MSARILIFDSGLGGLSVARAMRVQMASAELVYAADNFAFPYGDWREPELIKRISSVIDDIISVCAPDALIVACNTASTIALEALRKQFDVPFIGTVPAIKPAAEISKSGLIGVLATPGTVDREYTRALIDTFAFHRNVKLHGCPNLAAMAEAALRNEEVTREELAEEIEPAFVEQNGAKTDVLVLGCTHYPLIARQIAEAAPWPVTLIDPSCAIARHAAKVVSGSDINEIGQNLEFDAVLTKRSENVSSILKREGFSRVKVLTS
ncbi:MAG: glutamate racemase [Hyphomicrobiales bacterium]